MRDKTRQWKQADGKVILIDDMDDSHLINSLNMLERAAPRYKEKLLHDGYQALAIVQGEQAEYDIEQDISRLEDMDAKEVLSEIMPVYENMLDLVRVRKLKR